MSNLKFSDVPKSYWASEYIYYAAEKGVVSGYDDCTFRPGNQVTIGQFCSMAVNAAKTKPFYGDSWESKPDDTDYHWARKYVKYVRNVKKLHLYAEDSLSEGLPAE